MLWHLIYIFIFRVQYQETCCRNNIQTVPADRNVHSEHERGADEAENMKT